jgi:signal transduction histidine kinase
MRPRVLFVDDEPNLLETVQDLLRREYDVVTAERGADGLAMLAREDIPIVVSDLRMPEMDGVEFLERVRQRAPHTIRLLLTGHADLDTAVRAVNLGAIFRLMLKPCHPDTLRAALRDAVEQRRLVHADRDLLATKVSELTSRLLHSERLATLGTMAAAVGHEMNNALAVLHSTVYEVRQIYEEKRLVDEDTVGMLERGEARLRRHATHVLGLARPQQSERGRVDLGELARSTVTLLKELGGAKRVTVGVAVDGSQVHTIGDRGELEQAVLNLVKNSIEAIEDAKKRGGKVTVEVLGGDPVVMVVRDDGCGIPPDKLATIFEPFFTTKAAGRGTGLGLPVVKQIIEAHGGTLTLESTVNVGTAFTIRLPAG